VVITGNNNNNNTSLLAPGDTGELSTRIPVTGVETAHINNLAVRWSYEYPLYFLHGRYTAKLRYETLLLL